MAVGRKFGPSPPQIATWPRRQEHPRSARSLESSPGVRHESARSLEVTGDARTENRSNNRRRRPSRGALQNKWSRHLQGRRLDRRRARPCARPPARPLARPSALARPPHAEPALSARARERARPPAKSARRPTIKEDTSDQAHRQRRSRERERAIVGPKFRTTTLRSGGRRAGPLHETNSSRSPPQTRPRC